ncbi:3-dehydroquinate synthase [Chitinophaga terrae (ex Kim and Jung 2007)]|uniref:3-dehydroquinate synthase n=1 Tax=Chitinophaga terrae (ex Kim and Jung 2007) TaxID=408074 RepID=A0A1H4FD40_9BACT|nr:3-dehydroquinate synthase [Chitinophaga terrae (ex Kim and Jung 2007)]GEP92425.1 3-dehydroquinate synthase [Chitinophaga terrae (ex Kim and Jung 2007)]SEA95259.1 3-dehydroquinate synthase [Chitinophaga terrae (ex Kim and Jung 2007)]
MEYIQQKFDVSFSYNVFFSSHLFDLDNKCLSSFLESNAAVAYTKKLLVVLDGGVANAHPGLSEKISTYLGQVKGFQLAPEIITISGGEQVKNDLPLLFSLVDAIDKYKIDRHSYVIGVGGGSLLDLVGFVAAISHRGVKHIRIPTTVLSQNDSGVGVKNGVNYKGKKNFLGSFAPPAAVFNDAHFLTTLDDRDWRSGMAEAVKVSLIKDAEFFNWIASTASAITAGDREAMQEQIIRCAALHIQHIGGAGDPFESGSSRPLDFGHWSAHKLEQLTDFSLRHGEAVAIGIATDTVYSYLLGWLPEPDMLKVLKVLKDMKLPVWHPLMEKQNGVPSPVVAGLEEFREHLGGQLTISLLRAIGKGEEVHHMDLDLLYKAVEICKNNQ